MSVTITSVLFTDEYTGLPSGHGSDNGQDQLKGCVGDLMWVTIQGYVKWSSESIPVSINATSKTITRQDCSGTGSYITDGFKAGDTITVTGCGDANDGNYTISTVTALVLTLTSALALTKVYSSVSIYGTTPISNGLIDYYANVVPNDYADNHFASMTDTKVIQKFTGSIPAIGSQNYLPPNARSWAWWDGYDINAGYYYGGQPLEPVISVQSTSNYKQYFTIQHRFFIKPFYTADQLQLLTNAFDFVSAFSGTDTVNVTTGSYQVPNYFQDDNCLKYIAQIDIRFNQYSKAVDHSSDGYEWSDGNTAWFNEAPKSNPDDANVPLYYSKSTKYYVNGTATQIDSIDYKNKTDVVITLADGVFNSSDPIVINFMWLPSDAKAYQDYNAKTNPATFRTVFMHDRVRTTVGAAAANGDQWGSKYQIIKSAQAAISGSGLSVTFTTDFGSGAQSVMDAIGGNGSYMIWVTPQDKHVPSLSKTTRNAAICDVNAVFTSTDNASLFAISTDGTTDEHFFRYPDVDVNPVTNYAGVSGDIAYSKIGFKILDTGKLKSIRVHFDVTAVNSLTGDSNVFTIDDWGINLTDTFNGKYSDVDVSESKGYALAYNDIRNQINITRDATLDSGAYYGYKMTYGFQCGYQYWQFLTNYAPEVVDYSTQYWAVYTQGYASGGTALFPVSSIKIQKVTEWVIEDTATGIDTTFIHYSDVSVNDQYLSGWKPTVSIATQDTNGNDMSGAIASDAQTQIVATLLGNGVNIGTVPAPYSTIVGSVMVFYDNGTSQVYDIATTAESNLSTSLWVSQPVVTVVSPANVTITAILDLTLSATPVTVTSVAVKLGYKI